VNAPTTIQALAKNGSSSNSSTGSKSPRRSWEAQIGLTHTLSPSNRAALLGYTGKMAWKVMTK